MLSRNASSPFENVRQNTDPRSVLFLPDKCAIPRPVHVAISEPSFVIRTPCPSAERYCLSNRFQILSLFQRRLSVASLAIYLHATSFTSGFDEVFIIFA